jgi:hypothetical protein
MELPEDARDRQWRLRNSFRNRTDDARYEEMRRERERELARETDITTAIAAAADRIAAYTDGLKEGRRMSLLGKMKHLTESAQDFNTKTGQALDGIQAKIDASNVKRDEAVAKHHAYYDEVNKGVDETIAVIDQLSNGVPNGG